MKMSLLEKILTGTAVVSLVGLLGCDNLFENRRDNTRHKIVYESKKDFNFEICRMNTDGSNIENLTNEPSVYLDRDPSYSPDGTKIVFISSREGSGEEVYVMDSDGNNQTRLTYNNSLEESPSYSPDGTKIVFCSGFKGNYDIFVMDSDGSNLTRLTDDPEIDGAPSWSSDGTKIFFHSERSGSAKLYTMNPDGTNQTGLAYSTAGLAVSCSPKGDKIAFESGGEIYVADTDGNNPMRLTDNTFYDGMPAWSPDGNQIAFHSTRDGSREIYTMNPDGTSQTRLTIDNDTNGHPAYSPNEQ